MKTPKEIVEECFQGLDELIEDKELLQWYKSLIETCIEMYGEELIAPYRKAIECWAEEELIGWKEENKEVLKQIRQDEFLTGCSRSHMDENGKLTRLDPLGD